jgi:hypothetical protein
MSVHLEMVKLSDNEVIMWHLDNWRDQVLLGGQLEGYLHLHCKC